MAFSSFKALATAALISLMSVPATAGDASLEITNPRVLESMRMAKAGAGYLEITNTGEAADTLIGATADFARAQIHTTEFSDDGVARMIHLEDGIEILPGETVTLEQGGQHIMFMGLEAPFKLEDTHSVTLIFAQAGEMTIDFSVMARKEGGGHGGAVDHNGHGDHGAPKSN